MNKHKTAEYTKYTTTYFNWYCPECGFENETDLDLDMETNRHQKCEMCEEEFALREE